MLLREVIYCRSMGCKLLDSMILCSLILATFFMACDQVF